MELLEIEIINWDKYNPKRDQQTYTWLRLNNDISTDPDLFGLSAEQKYVWIEILCQASRKNSGKLSINLDQIAHITGVKIDRIRQLLEFLKAKPIVRVHDNARSPVVASATPTNVRDERTNETYVTNMAPAVAGPVTNASKVYLDAYKAKYGHYPDLGPKQHGILKRFTKSHPKRWQELIEGYLSMPDSWAVARSHPVELLESKLNEISRFLATGKVVTKKVVQHAEEMIDKAQGTNRRPRKSIEELEKERAEMLADAEAQKAIGGAT